MEQENLWELERNDKKVLLEKLRSWEERHLWRIRARLKFFRSKRSFLYFRLKRGGKGEKNGWILKESLMRNDCNMLFFIILSSLIEIHSTKRLLLIVRSVRSLIHLLIVNGNSKQSISKLRRYRFLCIYTHDM